MALSASEVQDQNRSEVPTQTTTNTPYGNIVMKCKATNQPFALPRYTTLNERYNIMSEESIGPKMPTNFEMKYFGVGIRGANCVGTDAMGVSKMKVNQHQPIDMNLFVHIPVACRPVDNDFDNVNRGKYRLRVIENGFDGQAYVFYYLRLIDFSRYNPEVNKITRDESGNELPVPFVPSRDSLFNPQPVSTTSEGSVPIDNTYINSSAVLGCSFNQGDLQELANACQKKYGDASYASINETMVCWGVDTQIDGTTGGGGTIRFAEVQSALVAHFITERDARSALNNERLNMDYDHGASEPMLIFTNATAGAASQGN